MPLDAVHEVEGSLRAAGVPSPRVDAEILVADVLGLARSELYSSGRPVTAFETERLDELVGRRLRREPLAYILGEWGFRRLLLKVDDRALIPRPETEVVVERCLAFLGGLTEPRVLDVGVGSGAIALAIADEHDGAQVVAVDSSEQALSLARENQARAGVNGRVRLVRGDLLSGVEGPFDLVVSNPPYVSADELGGLEPELRREPCWALVGEGAHEAVATAARDALAPGAPLVFEVGDGQAASVSEVLTKLGYSEVRVSQDLAGRERVVEGRRRP
jgi:release factor glutamine methyltransferase